ncbi:uracil-DNA glycosylase [bacterium]|nr:uracil-DNA glycosylase [bacterium]
MDKIIGNSWDAILKSEFEKPYFMNLESTIDQEYETFTCFPKKENIFNCFKLTPYENIKVVILGQDPYINDNEAMGLCFSVKEGIPYPPSLKNIFIELKNDTDCTNPKSGDLTNLAQEGVFLLNTTLTVRKGISLSHKGLGWEEFSDNVIKLIAKRKTPVVFILWGANARAKKKFIDTNIHCVIESSHPSPLSAYNGFFNSKPFSKANKFLMEHEIEPVDWSVIE